LRKSIATDTSIITHSAGVSESLPSSETKSSPEVGENSTNCIRLESPVGKNCQNPDLRGKILWYKISDNFRTRAQKGQR